jgi:hypothetical protein
MAAALCLLLASVSIICLTPQKAYAARDMTIAVSDGGDVIPGTDFYVSVSAADNPGFAAVVFQLSFDTRAFEFVGVGPDGLLAQGMVYSIENSTVSYLSGSNFADSGMLFTLLFHVREDAPNGSYQIHIGLRDNNETNLVAEDTQPVPAVFYHGNVTVGGGGASGDGGASNNGGESSASQNSVATSSGFSGAGLPALFIVAELILIAVAAGGAFYFMNKRRARLKKLEAKEGVSRP